MTRPLLLKKISTFKFNVFILLFLTTTFVIAQNKSNNINLNYQFQKCLSTSNSAQINEKVTSAIIKTQTSLEFFLSHNEKRIHEVQNVFES